MNAPLKPMPNQFGLTEAEVKDIERVQQGGLPGWAESFLGNLMMFLLFSPILGIVACVSLEVRYPTNLAFFYGSPVAAVALYFACKYVLRWWVLTNTRPIKEMQYQRYQRAFAEYETRLEIYRGWQREEQRKQEEERRRREEERRKQREERRKQEEFWRHLSGREFECELAEVFRKAGYQVEETKASGDEGIDLFLSKGTSKIVVQCKAHKKPVGSPVIRDVYGAMMHVKAHRAIVASVGGFTEAAKEFAKGKPIRLLDLDGIVALANKTREMEEE